MKCLVFLIKENTPDFRPIFSNGFLIMIVLAIEDTSTVSCHCGVRVFIDAVLLQSSHFIS